MPQHSPELIRQTKDLFEPRYGRELSDEEAREIIDNAVNYMKILIALDQKQEKSVGEAFAQIEE